MARDPLKDPRFGDIFRWKGSDYTVVYIRSGPGKMWQGMCVGTSLGYKGQVGETITRVPLSGGWSPVEVAAPSTKTEIKAALENMTTEELAKMFARATEKGLLR